MQLQVTVIYKQPLVIWLQIITNDHRLAHTANGAVVIAEGRLA